MKKTTKTKAASKKALKLKSRVRGGDAPAKLGLNHNSTIRPLKLRARVRGGDAPAKLGLNHNCIVC